MRPSPRGALFTQAGVARLDVVVQARISKGQAGELAAGEDGFVTPLCVGRADRLAEAIRAASRSDDGTMSLRAVEAAARFDRTTAMNAYAALIDELLRNPDLSEQR